MVIESVSEPQGNLRAIREHVATIKAHVQEHARTEIAPSGMVVKQVSSPTLAADQLASLAEELVANPAESVALRALNGVSVLDAELELLEKRVQAGEAGPPEPPEGWDKLKEVLKAAIRAISQHLWQIISTALTLKEWSIEGELGTGILGFASVKMALTFGK